MKKVSLILALLALSAFLLLTNCTKNKEEYNAYFYTTHSTSEIQLSLFIDDEYYGELPYLNPKPSCSDDTQKAGALYVKLSNGKHKLVAKDKQGVIRSSGILKISNNNLSSSSGKDGRGGQEINHKGQCLVIGMFY